MAQAALFFGVALDFDVTINEQLKLLSALRFWDKGRQQYVYIFSTENLSKVQALMKPLQFNEDQVVSVVHHADQQFEDVILKRWKGKSGFEIVSFPKFYRVINFQKPTPDGKPKRYTHDIPKETVLRVWKVLKTLEKDQFYEFKEIAKLICKEFELDRFFYDNGEFRIQMWQGTRCPHEYGFYQYFPSKILEHYGCLQRRGRWIARISDEWVEQTEFCEVDYVTH